VVLSGRTAHELAASGDFDLLADRLLRLLLHIDGLNRVS
jgi:hypothetical protein